MDVTAREDLGVAIVRRIARHLGQDVDPHTVDRQAALFAEGGFQMGDYRLDSLELVELVVTLEADFDVSILDSRDLGELDTLDKLTVFIAQHADDERIAAFKGQWT